MVGLKDDYGLNGSSGNGVWPNPQLDHPEDARHSAGAASSQGSEHQQQQHGHGQGHGDTARARGSGNLPSSTSSVGSTSGPASTDPAAANAAAGPTTRAQALSRADQGSFRSPGRSRSKSMAHFNHPDLPPHRGMYRGATWTAPFFILFLSLSLSPLISFASFPSSFHVGPTGAEARSKQGRKEQVQDLVGLIRHILPG